MCKERTKVAVDFRTEVAKLRLRLLLMTLLALSGCDSPDPLSAYVNENWPPNSRDKAQQEAITSAAKSASYLTAPNLVVGAR